MYPARLPPSFRSDVIIYTLAVLASFLHATPTPATPTGITTPVNITPLLKFLTTTVQNNATTGLAEPTAKNATPWTSTTSTVHSRTLPFLDNIESLTATAPTTDSGQVDITAPDVNTDSVPQTGAPELKTTIADQVLSEYPTTTDSFVLNFNRRRKTMSKINSGGPEFRITTKCSDTVNGTSPGCYEMTTSYLADSTGSTGELGSTASYSGTDTVDHRRKSIEEVNIVEGSKASESSTSSDLEMLMTALRGVEGTGTGWTLTGLVDGASTPPAPPPTPRGRYSARIKASVGDTESTTSLARELTTTFQAETTSAHHLRPTPIVFTVKPTYMKFKKITIVPSQPFRRDPKDNSWRDESISSLGIKFTPRHAKPFTFKPKSKTEFEALVQNTNSSVSDSTEPALRERLEKLSEMRKSKKKKLNEVTVESTGGGLGGNVYYRPVKENSNDTDALTKKLLAYNAQPAAHIAEFDMDYSEEVDNVTVASLEADYETIRKEFNYSRNLEPDKSKVSAFAMGDNVSKVQVYQASADDEPGMPMSPYFEEFVRYVTAAATTPITTTTVHTTTTTPEPTTYDEIVQDVPRVSDILNAIDNAGKFPADFPLLYNTSVVHSEAGPGRGAASSHAFLRQQYALIAEEEMAERRASAGYQVMGRAGRPRTRAPSAPRSPLDTEYEEPGYRHDADAEQMETQLWIGPFWSRR